MPNMSYCRFRNTLSDLRDCLEALHNREIEFSQERDAALKMREICEWISEYTDEDIEEMYAENGCDFYDDYEEDGED